MFVENESRFGNATGRGGSLLNLVSDVVSAYVSNNSVSSAEITDIIYQVYQALTHLNQEGFVGEAANSGAPLEPAVPVGQSVMSDYIVCLEDGKKLKMLKRHLKASYNMTPDQYRDRWGLPDDYPMVAPSYAKKRSVLAKINGLGQQHSLAKKVQV